MKQSQKIQLVKQQAKRMSERLQKMGFNVTPRQALELVAAERGFATWNAYEAELRKPEPKAPKWTRKQGAMSLPQYLAHRSNGDNNCPRCGSSEIEGEFVEIAGQFALQECGCNLCETTWVDRYTIDSFRLLHDGLGSGTSGGALLNVYEVAAYDGETFTVKGLAFGKDEDAAREIFGESVLGARRFSANLVMHIQYECQVMANLATLVAWWTGNDVDEDALDELVYTAVQEHGLPELNEEASRSSQESFIEDREAFASRLNNEGIEAQLEYLLSVREAGSFFTMLANEVGLAGLPKDA
jgi:hypothetical protein